MGAENQEIVRLGKSILVPSVQELAKECLEKVPDKYVQINQDPVLLAANDHLNDLQLPIINIKTLLNGDTFELEKLHSTCQEWGFFQIIDHGIDQSLMEKVKLETEEFFNLPLEEKKKYGQTPNEVEGYGQAFVVSEEQKLDWADVFICTTHPKHLRRPNLLPMLPLPFRDTLEKYSGELQNLTSKLLDCMAKALKIDTQVMRRVFGDEGLQSFRMNYYPPCPQPDKVIGLTAHSDAVALTILLQSDEIEGLQVWKDGHWVPIKPIPGAFVVNIGDILEIASNGIYRSVLHRSVVNATKARISIATFHSPPLDGEIGPLPDLVMPGTEARFKKIGVADYFKEYFSRPLNEKSYLDLMKIDEHEHDT